MFRWIVVFQGVDLSQNVSNLRERDQKWSANEVLQPRQATEKKRRLTGPPSVVYRDTSVETGFFGRGDNGVKLHIHGVKTSDLKFTLFQSRVVRDCPHPTFRNGRSAPRIHYIDSYLSRRNKLCSVTKVKGWLRSMGGQGRSASGLMMGYMG